MKRRRRTLLRVLLLTLLASLALAGVATAAETLTVQLAEQNYSGETGTAVLEDLGNGKTKVTLIISGAPVGVAQPAHIHEGSCTNLTPTPKYPLTAIQGGKSETTVDVALADLVAQPFAVNVHKSGQEASIYVACGNITAAGTGGVPAAMPRVGAGGLAGAPAAPPWLALATLVATLTASSLRALRRRR